MQTVTLADIKASNTASSIELSATAANISAGAKLTVTNNLLKSTAVANTVTNQATLSGTNFTAPALTLADKGAVIGANTTVVATSALANDQTSTNNTLTSSVGEESAFSKVLLQVTKVDDASVLTLSDNKLASVAYNNNATNGMTLSVTNATGATGALASRQSVDTSSSGSSKSETFGGVKLNASGAVEGTSSAKPNLTVSGNSITADNVGNSATNQMAVTASQWNGRVAADGMVDPSLAVGTGLSTSAKADLTVANQQNVLGTGASTAVIESNVVGTVENNFASLTLGNITSNANTVSAAATGSTASNGLTMSTTGMTGTTLGVASLQVMNSGKISSTAKTSTLDVGVTKTDAGTGAVVGGNVSVNDNAVLATSQANAVSNSLSVTATNATGTTATVVPTSSYDLTTMSVVADVALVNNQATLASNVEATVGTDSTTPSRIKSDVGAVSLSTNASNLTLNSNSVASAAYANKASNSVAVAANSMIDMSAGLGNAQMVAQGSLNANTYGKVDSQLASIANSNASVNTNVISASVLGNNATNSLAVSGSNASGRDVQPSFTMNGAVTVADLVLNNAQAMNNNTVSAVTNGDIQLVSDGAVTGAVDSRSSLNLNSNTISAYGSSNYASNSLVVSSTTLSGATSALMSMQATKRAIADEGGPLTLDGIQASTTGSMKLQATAVSDANLALNSNSIKSTALDNAAVNRVILTGSNATGSSLAMTGLQSPITSPGSSSVAADVSLINLQASTNDGNMTALTGYTSILDSDVAAVTLAVNVVGATDASITASGNNVSSLLYANNASNALGLNVTTVRSMTAALLNTQQVSMDAESLGKLSAKTRGDISLTSTDVLSTSNLTLNNNSITATAGANDAGSAMIVVATDLVGRDLASRETSVGSFQVLKDFALGNQQQLINATTVEAKATGDVHMDVGSNTIGNGSLTLSGNTLSATGSGNNATNALSMSATNVSKASMGIASEQTLSDGTKVTGETTGSIKMTGGVTTDSALTAADNTIKSTALGNLANNTLTATASNFTGPTASTVSAVVGSGTTSVAADFAIANKQVNESTSDIQAKTLGTVQMALGDVTGTTSSSSSNSLTGNTLKALAQSNSASNEIKLTVTELRSATAGVASYQSSAAAVYASVGPDTSSSVSNPGLFLVKSGDVENSSITVSGNAASALAGMNEAFNTLTVTGSNLLARGGAVTAPTVGTVSSTGADFAVMNSQSASGSAEALLNAGASGFRSTGNFAAGSVTVNANSLLARASANTANNTLTLAASNRLEASGVVNNLQQMADGATVKASIVSTSALGVELASTSGEAVVTVKDNTVTAQATGNVANNALNASANNAITAAGASATPSFAVLNYQKTGTAPTQTSTPSEIEADPTLRKWGVQSAINGISIGGAQLGGALNGGSVTAAGNQVLSVAYGNSANNSVVVSPLSLSPTLNTASASITSVQYNLTSVSATIGGTTVQASGVAGSSGANVGITGNSIVAMAVGNRSVNSITGR
jgi:trimeric autotransporter adhesin